MGRKVNMLDQNQEDTSQQPLELVFIPALWHILSWKEKEKGAPLTREEVLKIREKAICLALPLEQAKKFLHNRGYEDIDPDNCWEEWCFLRKKSLEMIKKKAYEGLDINSICWDKTQC